MVSNTEVEFLQTECQTNLEELNPAAAEVQTVHLIGAVRRIMDLHRRFPNGGFHARRLLR